MPTQYSREARGYEEASGPMHATGRADSDLDVVLILSGKEADDYMGTVGRQR